MDNLEPLRLGEVLVNADNDYNEPMIDKYIADATCCRVAVSYCKKLGRLCWEAGREMDEKK